jgi:hypothetical protein
MRTALFWVITQQVVMIYYRHLRTKSWLLFRHFRMNSKNRILGYLFLFVHLSFSLSVQLEDYLDILYLDLNMNLSKNAKFVDIQQQYLSLYTETQVPLHCWRSTKHSKSLKRCKRNISLCLHRDIQMCYFVGIYLYVIATMVTRTRTISCLAMSTLTIVFP